jgi:hypothetical protein
LPKRFLPKNQVGLKPKEEEKAKVYSPGTPSGDSSNKTSVEEAQNVQHLDVVSASVHEVSIDPS